MARRTRLPRNPTSWDFLARYHYARCPEGDITGAFLQELAERQRTCPYCDAELTEANRQLEHLTPICRGGGNWKENVAFACAPCNVHKGTRTFEEYMRLIGAPGFEVAMR